jgi:hypothetical protein
VDLIGADLALGLVHPLLDLGQELVDQLRAGDRAVHAAAGVPGGDVAGHGVVRAAGQLPGVPKRPGQVERF